MQTEEDRLKVFIESVTDGRVVSLQRQARWRKAWFCEIERAGKKLPLYIRGDKQLDAEPYPGLGREASILQLLEAGGVVVPHVYGVCPDPIAIVMDMAPGDRDVSKAANDDERRSIAEQYIEALAKMHSLDLEPFVAAGITRPQGAAQTVLAYIDANQPLYDRTKRRPEPMIEFALRWLRRNVPQQRTHAAFIHGDAGQFLFQNAKVTALYDFEASHIGDPLADLASLRGRNGFEPLGADMAHLLKHYAKITGEPIDSFALSYHTAAFMLTAVMALAGLLCEPDKHVLQTEYLIWNLMSRRSVLWALAECMNVKIAPSAPPAGLPSRNSVIIDVLEQTITRIEPKSDLDKFQLESAKVLAQWLRDADAGNRSADDNDLARIAEFTGRVPRDWQDGEKELERFVLEAGPEHDIALLNYFARQLEDQIAIAVPIQSRLAGYALEPIKL
ncbi:MAG: putative aminoglycoside phospho-transferase [Verrucomicrobiaceae bacterium]|nr:putative aminoglycoside phospho-transferase [Verrucomicrobiaceae bacterium]